MRAARNKLVARRARRGVQTLELLLVLPTLLVATLATFELGFIALGYQAVVNANTAAARTASEGATPQQLKTVATTLLAPHQITLEPGSGARLVAVDGTTGTVTDLGDPAVDCQAKGPAPAPGEVQVTLCVELTAAHVPDALATFGLSIAGKKFEVSSLVPHE